VTNEEVWEMQHAATEWKKTRAGLAFFQFESAIGRAWQTDSREGASDKAMKRDWDAADKARAELVAAIKELQQP